MISFVGGVQVYLLSSLIDVVVRCDLSDDLADVWFVGEPLKDVRDAAQLSVSGVIVPGKDRHGVLRLEHIGNWGVVNDDDVCHLTPQTSHVFYIGVGEPGAMLSEEFVRAVFVWVDNIY